MRDGGKLTFLLLVALGLRLGGTAATTGLGHYPTRYFEYTVAGSRLLETGTHGSPLIPGPAGDGPSSLMAPVYAGVVASIYGLFGPNTEASTLALQLINALAGMCTVWLCYAVARQWAGHAAGWVAGWFAAVNPLLFGYTSYVWDTCLFMLGVVVTLWWIGRLTQKAPTPGRMWLFGLWLGLLALLNPSMTVVYPVFVLWPLLEAHGKRFRPIALGAAAALLGWGLASAPWTVRNYHHFDEFRYVRGGLMMEFWLGSCPEADEAPGDVYRRYYPYPSNAAACDHVAAIGEEAFLRECGVRAKAAIYADPVRYLRMTLVRSADYWLGTVFTHVEPGAGGWPPPARRAAVTAFLIGELLFLLACLALAGRPRGEVLWLLVAAVLFSVVYCLTHIQLRYRAPAEPFIAIAVGILVEQIINRRRMRIARQ